MSDKKIDETVTAEAAKLALEKDRQTRIAACTNEMNEILKKHNCTMDATMILKNGVVPQVQIIVLSF